MAPIRAGRPASRPGIHGPTRRGRRWLLVLGAIGLAAVAAIALWAWSVRPWEPVHVEVVQDGLDHPWDIAFSEDGLMLVTERTGDVLVFESALPDAPVLFESLVPHVRPELEAGLMGIAVRDGSAYVCASRDPDGDEGAPWLVELLRAELHPDGWLGAWEPIPIGATLGGPRHQGCAVEIDEDGAIWLSIGDGNVSVDHPSQDPASSSGKVLRLMPDGAAVAGSPFDTPVYTLGHRNPQGIAIREDGLVVVAEHGTDVNDELNVVVPGGNYGYPCYTGVADTGPLPDGCGIASEYLAPAWASGSSTLAVSGATFLRRGTWGDWEGDLVVSTLKEEDLRRFSVSPAGEVQYVETLLDGRFGRLRAVVIGPDGALYVSTSNGSNDRIIRVDRSG